MTWQARKAWADQYTDQLLAILQPLVGKIATIRPADQQSDMKRATDLIATIPEGDIGIRVRDRIEYRDLSLRSRVSSGMTSEVPKIKAGWCTWYLYGWVDNDDKVSDWMFVDMNVFREKKLWEGAVEKDNWDGKSSFILVPWRKLADAGAVVDAVIYGRALSWHMAPCPWPISSPDKAIPGICWFCGEATKPFGEDGDRICPICKTVAFSGRPRDYRCQNGMLITFDPPNPTPNT
jgi:hypothetical protein